MKQKIALIGYGIIGKRVADALDLQDNMEFDSYSQMILNVARKLQVR